MAGRAWSWRQLLGLVVAGAATFSCQIEPGTGTGGHSSPVHASWPALDLVGGLAVQYPRGWQAQNLGGGNVIVRKTNAVLTITLEPHGSAVVAQQRLEAALLANRGTRVEIG